MRGRAARVVAYRSEEGVLVGGNVPPGARAWPPAGRLYGSGWSCRLPLKRSRLARNGLDVAGVF